MAFNELSPREKEAQAISQAAGGTDRSVEQGEPVPKRRQPGDLWRLLSLPMLVFMLLPMAALLLRTTPAEWITNLALPQVRQAIGLSLATTLITLILTIIFGTPIAYWLSQDRSFLRRIVDSFVDLPTVLPPSVAGVALLMAFGRRGVLSELLGPVDLQIAFTPLAVVLAQTFVASPYYIRAAAAGFSRIEGELKQSAALDGASNWEIFRYVVVPLAGVTLVSGGVMSWARALGEFGATMIFAGNFPGRTQTMPLAIYLGFEFDSNVALTLSVLLLLISFVTLLVVKWVLHRDWL